MTTLDFISLIDGLEYCLEDMESDEGWMHCDECPLISNEFTCLLHERLRQYHEWKKSHEISLRR